jgi:hypothetical protein
MTETTGFFPDEPEQPEPEVQPEPAPEAEPVPEPEPAPPAPAHDAPWIPDGQPAWLTDIIQGFHERLKALGG